MNLYLLRHAVAAERDPRKYPRDHERPLTPEGRVKMRRAALGMKALGLRFDLILTSPLTRARQTARIVASELKASKPPLVLRPLAPGGTTVQILEGIPSAARKKTVVLVGHEPDLSRLASELLLPSNVDLAIEMKKGALCRIDFDDEPRPGSGRLSLLLPPRVLRMLVDEPA